MELRHLRYFVAVAETLNFRKAAGRVRVAQPSLSKQIKDLEFELGVKLFARNTAGVALTDAGCLFLGEARELLDRAAEAVSAVREAEAGRRGSLNVANLSVISASFMPATLSAFRVKYPDVDVNLHEMPLPEQMTALEEGGVQVGFAVDPGVKFPDHIDAFQVLESEVAVALSREHPLARDRCISIHSLVSEKMLCFETGRHDLHRRRILGIFGRRGVRHGTIKAVNSLESLQAMIEGDQGVSFLAATKAVRRTEGIVLRPLKEKGDDLRFVLFAILRKRGPSQLALNFVEVLRSVCGAKRAAGETD